MNYHTFRISLIPFTYENINGKESLNETSEKARLQLSNIGTLDLSSSKNTNESVSVGKLLII
jgi:hypothetical protein